MAPLPLGNEVISSTAPHGSPLNPCELSRTEPAEGGAELLVLRRASASWRRARLEAQCKTCGCYTAPAAEVQVSRHRKYGNFQARQGRRSGPEGSERVNQAG